MLPLITNEQISDYQRDGVVLVRNLFDAEWLQVLAEGIEENLRNPSKRTSDYVNDAENGIRFFYDARVLGEVSGYDRVS